MLVEPFGDLQRRLPPQLDDDAGGAFVFDNVEDALPVDGLEVELIGHVEVGRDRLRVAVHHDGFVTELPGGIDAVHARIVELDALADAVGTAAENDHLFPVRHVALALALVRRVEVRCLGRKFAGAGIDHLEGRRDAQRLSILAHVHFLVLAVEQKGDLHVREAVLLHASHKATVHFLESALADLRLDSDDVLDLV